MVLKSDHTTSAEAEEHVAFTDAALALAGHSVADPVLRDLMTRVAKGEVSADDAVVTMRCRVQG